VERDTLIITNPITVIALHIAVLIGAIMTFGIIFGALVYVGVVWMLNTGELI
jgi:hypothetical protein